MSGLHLDVCLVYLDDIILFSRTVEEHLERLVRVLGRLRRLRTAGLKLKPEKCSIMQRSVSFLGHIDVAPSVAAGHAVSLLVDFDDFLRSHAVSAVITCHSYWLYIIASNDSCFKCCQRGVVADAGR